MLDLRRLRLLRELDARHTVRAAAQALGYTTSAVSQQLSVLEREVGTALFERVGRNLRLTDAGRVLARHAQTLLEAAETAEAEVAQVAAGQAAGTVRVAAFQSAFLHIVAPAIRDLALSHPRIRVEVEDLEAEQGVSELRGQHLDVVVGDEYDNQPRPVWTDLARIPLVRERVRLVLPPGHPAADGDSVPLAALRSQAWAGSKVGTGHYDMHVRACRQFGGFEPDMRYASDDFRTLLELVRTSEACALLPELVLGRDTRGVAVRDVAEQPIGRSVYLLTRSSRRPTVLAVTETLQRRAALASQYRVGRPARSKGAESDGSA